MSRHNPTRLVATTILAVAVLISAAGRSEESPYNVVSNFLSLDDGKPVTASELSGIACREPVGGRLSCLVVDNEAPFVQPVWIENRTLTPGKKIGIVLPEWTAVPNVAGSLPSDIKCSKQAKDDSEKRYGDMDGEGIAYDGGWFYVVGSHGCTRKKGEFRPGMFLLSRLQFDDNGAVTGEIQRSFRLSEALAATAAIRPHFLVDLDKGGVNIEGIAARQGRLLIGLRAPSTAKGAHLLSVSADETFSNGARPLASEPCTLDLGTKSGVRDLSFLPDGRLLILSGPSANKAPSEPDGADAFSLWVAPLRADGCPEQPTGRLLADVARGDPPQAWAEAVVLVRCERASQRVLVLYDGVENGGAREFEVQLGAEACGTWGSQN